MTDSDSNVKRGTPDIDLPCTDEGPWIIDDKRPSSYCKREMAAVQDWHDRVMAGKKLTSDALVDQYVYVSLNDICDAFALMQRLLKAVR